MLSTPGVGSGLDVNSIINQLMSIEQKPLLILQTRKTNLDAQISSFGKVKNGLSSLQSSIDKLKETANYSKFTAVSSDEKVFTATTSDGTASEAHSIVVTSLAANHRLSSTNFASTSTVVGTGTLTISNGSDSFQLTIDSTNNTLAGIRDAINNSSSNTGTQASIVTVTDGAHLILTAKSSGLSEAIQVNVSGDGEGTDTDMNGLSRLVYQTAGTKNLTQENAAADATLTIDNLPLSSSSNTVTGAISGITLNLIGAGTAELTTKEDFSSIESAMSSFEKSYNSLRNILIDVRAKGMSGDNFLLGIESKLRGIFSNKVAGDISYVSDVGFSFDKNGVLSFTSSKLSAELANDPAAVRTLFTLADSGFAVQMNNAISLYTSSGGLIASKTSGLNSTISDINSRIIDLDFRLKKTEERLLAQYSALDSLMSNLLATSNFLTQQLDGLLSLANSSQSKK